MSESYQAIARVYDLFNKDLDYAAWGEAVDGLFTRFLGAGSRLVLDLGCGTGRMTRELARRGHDIIGVDLSPDMLSVAMQTPLPKGAKPILYLCQDASDFELYGTVDAVVSCLDVVNYLPSAEKVGRCFDLVKNYLNDGGLFIFDVNTPYRFASVYADNVYVYEDETGRGRNRRDVFCVWQNDYDADAGKCDFYLSLFEQTADGTYTRRDETQTEYVYAPETLEKMLADRGFTLLQKTANLVGSPVTTQSEKIHYVFKKMV